MGRDKWYDYEMNKKLKWQQWLGDEEKHKRCECGKKYRERDAREWKPKEWTMADITEDEATKWKHWRWPNIALTGQQNSGSITAEAKPARSKRRSKTYSPKGRSTKCVSSCIRLKLPSERIRTNPDLDRGSLLHPHRETRRRCTINYDAVSQKGEANWQI